MNKIGLDKFVSGLSLDDKIVLLELLNQGITADKINEIGKEINNNRLIDCPHCHSREIYGHGQYRGKSRYKCRNCNKTFNETTGTAISGIKKPEAFQSYIKLLLESVSIRKTAAKLDINMATIFAWRHKLLASLSITNGGKFGGILECDDKQTDINEKGNRNLKRKGYKRPSDRQTKRGVSNDKISIIVAADRKNNTTMKVAKQGRIDVESIEKSIGNYVQRDNILCSDSHKSIISWAHSRGLEHHTFVASSRHIKDKCYHVQHVNSINNRFERWQNQFYGISTKYLQNYLNWFVLLDKIRNIYDKYSELIKIMFENNLAIGTFRNIQSQYEKLLTPQYSKT
jgi:transposase-like protein